MNAWINVFHSAGAAPSATIDVTGSAELTVSTWPVEFCANLETQPSHRWFEEAVGVVGATPSSVTKKGTQVAYSFPIGRPGEKFTITLGSVTLPTGEVGPLVLTLTRAMPPTVSLKVKQGDGPWSEADSSVTLAPGPLGFLLSFSREMDRESVEAALASTGLVPAAAWNADGSLVLDLDPPPPLVEIDLWEARDVLGLPLASQCRWSFYAGD